MATEEAAHDIMHARDRAAPIRWSADPGWRAVALPLGFVALYLALDRLSFIGPCTASVSRRGVHPVVSPWPY